MDQIIYLDNAATSFPKPDEVHNAIRDFYREKGVNPGRTGCDMAVEAGQMIDETRKLYSHFFNRSMIDSGGKKNPDRLVFTMNATMSLNLIINGMVGAGDHVVTTLFEHNSVIRPVNHKVKEGAEASYLSPDAEGYIDPEEVRRAIKGNTTLVVVNHASNVTGVVQDLAAIGAVCRDEGVPLAVDSAQTAGVIPIDMAECNISFLCFTGHKGLFGPAGTGGICIADDADVKGTIYGGTGVRSAHPFHLEEFPYRMEAGTLNLGGIAGLNAGLKWVMEKGVDQIRSHEIELLGILIDGLREIDGVTLYGPKELVNRVATLSINVANYDPSDVGTILDVDHNILTRTGLHCAPMVHQHHGTAPRGTIRFSVGPFNTAEEIEKAIRGVSEIAASRPLPMTV